MVNLDDEVLSHMKAIQNANQILEWRIRPYNNGYTPALRINLDAEDFLDIGTSITSANKLRATGLLNYDRKDEWYYFISPSLDPINQYSNNAVNDFSHSISNAATDNAIKDIDLLINNKNNVTHFKTPEGVIYLRINAPSHYAFNANSDELQTAERLVDANGLKFVAQVAEGKGDEKGIFYRLYKCDSENDDKMYNYLKENTVEGQSNESSLAVYIERIKEKLLAYDAKGSCRRVVDIDWNEEGEAPLRVHEYLNKFIDNFVPLREDGKFVAENSSDGKLKWKYIGEESGDLWETMKKLGFARVEMDGSVYVPDDEVRRQIDESVAKKAKEEKVTDNVVIPDFELFTGGKRLDKIWNAFIKETGKQNQR